MTNDELCFDLQALIDKYGLANATKEQLLVVAILTTVRGLIFMPKELLVFARFVVTIDE